jgi:hypothetical protein
MDTAILVYFGDWVLEFSVYLHPVLKQFLIFYDSKS